MTAKIEWEHAHQCPKCGFVVKAADIGLRTMATGVITCPKCGTSGPIKITIVKREDPNAGD